MLAPSLVHPDAAGGPAWSNVGPASIYLGAPGYNYAGRIAAVAADPRNADIIYIAAAGGGVWKTVNGGGSWTPLTDSMPWQAMGALAIDPENSQTIYAGTGEPNNSGDSQYGIGIYKSTNSGASWTRIPATGTNPFYRRAISKIIVDPRNSQILYVADCTFAVNGIYGGGGVWKSTDGGATWKDTTTNLSSGAQLSDLVMDPTNDQILYAADGIYFGDPENGIYKTTNGGTTWALAGTTPAGDEIGRISLGISTTTPVTIYAGVQDPNTYGLYGVFKSTDNGATWPQLTSCPDYMGGQGWYDQFVAVDPSNPNIVYVAGVVNYNNDTDAILESLDGGTTWTDLTNDVNGNGPHTDHHGVAFDANGKLLDGNDGGLWRLNDKTPGSTVWEDLNSNLCITQFTGIALHPTNPKIALGGSQDNGTELYNGSPQWNLSDGGDGGFVRIDQSHPLTMYHTYYYFTGGGFFVKSTDGGMTWNESDNGVGKNDHVGQDNNSNESDTANFYPPYIMDPANSSRLLLGTDHIYETTDSADVWTPIAIPNTSGFNPNDNPVDALTVKGSTIYATAGGQIFISKNDGQTWTTSNVPTASDYFSDITVDPTNVNNVYLVRDVFNDESNTGHVFHSVDGCVTWTDITGSLGDVPTSAVKYNPTTHTIYVGVDGGVYSSSNNGATWSQPGTGFAHVQVVDLEMNTTTNILAAATHGRGMWVLPLGLSVSGFAVNPSTVTSGTQSTGTVTLTGPAPSGGAVVTLASSKNSVATVPASVTVAAGATSATFTVTTSNPGAAPLTSTLTATYNNQSLTANITVNPVIKVTGLTVNPTTVTSGTSSTGTVTLSNPALAEGAVVMLYVNNNDIAPPASVTVPAGATTATFTIKTSNTGSAPVTAKITAKNAISFATATLTINPVIKVTGLTVNPTTVTSGTSSTGTVTLSNPALAGGAVVMLYVNNNDIAPPASVTVAAGATTATFTIKTSNTGSAPVTAKITAKNATSFATATLTVNPVIKVTGLTVNPTTVTSGTSSTGTVTLSNPALAGGAVVMLYVNNNDIAPPASVTVAAGATSATFTIKTSNTGSAPVTAKITAKNATSFTTATLTVNPVTGSPST